jgi:hypothetical protein
MVIPPPGNGGGTTTNTTNSTSGYTSAQLVGFAIAVIILLVVAQYAPKFSIGILVLVLVGVVLTRYQTIVNLFNKA